MSWKLITQLLLVWRVNIYTCNYTFLLVKCDFKRCTYIQIYTLVIYNIGVIEKNSAECTLFLWQVHVYGTSNGASIPFCKPY